ncbi:hypothetical protein A4S06_00910 [Erysipelotrichaceae bacterium MTC7]|nr:hypothetical protein A4S06_00910 [Erysipelotrichaceae bacterium MTC7]
MNDKKKPLIRFSGFTDDWEQRKLGKVVNIRSGWSPSEFITSESQDSEPYIKVDDLNYSARIQDRSIWNVKPHER